MGEFLGFWVMPMENPMKTSATLVNGDLEDFEKDLDLEVLLQGYRHPRRSRPPSDAGSPEREGELNIFRSGSAPPTVEGARNAIGSLFGDADLGGVDLINGYGSRTALWEEEVRSNPAYPSYYYSNQRVNPRLPHLAVSNEDWGIAVQRFQVGAPGFGRIGDRRKEVVAREAANGSSNSLFSLQPGLPPLGVGGELTKLSLVSQKKLARQPSAEWVERGNDDAIGPTSIASGMKKSFTDAPQDECSRTYAFAHHQSHPVSHNAFGGVFEPVAASDFQPARYQNELETANNLKTGASFPRLVRAQSLGSSISHSFASVLDSSLVRSKTPDAQIIGNVRSPCFPALGGRGENSSNGLSTYITDHHDIAVSLTGLNLSKSILVNEGNDVHGPSLQEFADKTDDLSNIPYNYNHYPQHKHRNKPDVDSLNVSSTPMLAIKNGVTDTNLSTLVSNGQINLPNSVISANIYQNLPSGSAISNGSGSTSQNPGFMDFDSSADRIGTFPVIQKLLTSANSQLDSGDVEGQYLNSINHAGSGLHRSPVDPSFISYLQQNNSAPSSAARLSDPFSRWNSVGLPQADLSAYQKASLKALLAQHKSHFGMPFGGKAGGLNHGYYGTACGHDKQYPANPTSSSIPSSLGTASSLRQGERFPCFPSMMRRSAGASVGSWNLENGFVEEGSELSLLEEFKSNKTRSFELSDIVGHVVEFSADQHGSRFIQQKLETASVVDKNKIFLEILPHAHALMTDVFGNYVIQKFLEHGTESQRKQLAGQLTGHVLPLSLQMYGCRVIQKALEVVDMDQKTQMVLELDGSVLKCVRDQNGNHVIQKCIQFVPQERIQFIISTFYGQVVPLSTHPYGCRVIQRVLEHCDDAKTQSIVMDEILQAVCTLAQDQYGNYVIQHVLQHGKEQERSAIICKLAGQIVKMSQQKFASNVIEKCLIYGTPEERQLLISEILGSTDENEPLQAMMKDQFGNYVVQKILETCDDQNREHILSRIKAHVNALKKYTYGKHIAARVEAVIAAGERRMGMSSNASWGPSSNELTYFCKNYEAYLKR